MGIERLVVRSIRQFLSLCGILEQLSISFRTSTNEGYDDYFETDHRPERTDRYHPLKSMFISPPAHSFYKSVSDDLRHWFSHETLRSSTLFGLAVSFKQFKLLMHPCKSHLRNLGLADLQLLPKQHRRSVRIKEEPRACLVEMSQWIRENFSLDTISLKDGIFNHGLQQFWLTPIKDNRLRKSKDGWLLERLERFLLRGGECPIQHLAIEEGMWDVHNEARGDEYPEYIDNDAYQGDDNFQISFDGGDLWPGEDDDSDSSADAIQPNLAAFLDPGSAASEDDSE